VTGLRARIRALTDPGRRDLGISLAELLVSMMVFAVLMAITGSFMVGASRASSQSRTIDEATRVATNAMTAVSRNLRAATDNPVSGQPIDAPAFELAKSNSVRFYAYVNLTSAAQTPVMVQYDLTGGQLVESTWPSSVTADGFFTFNSAAAPKRRVVGTPMVQGTGTFTYLDAAGAEIPLSADAVPASKVSTVAAVRVRLQAGKGTTSATSTTLVNTVGLPNLDIARTLTP
jgi:type II secretory pathway pseudopilin PulG